MNITKNGGTLNIGEKDIMIANILFLDNDIIQVYINLTARRLGYKGDTNGITLPYASTTVAGVSYGSSILLQGAIVNLIK
jgi:hypothetical protein